MDVLIDECKDLYKRLFEEVKKFNKKHNNKLTICPSIEGKEYQSGGIMVCGRAINGWCPIDESVDNDDIIERLKKCSSCGLEWVIGENNWEHCRDKCKFASDDKIDGRRSSSPFWLMVKYILGKEYGVSDENAEEYIDKIVWTNLYKVSYEDGGNPEYFYKPQIKICNEILIKEIECYMPKKIYFITERKNCVSKDKRTWFCEHYKKDEELNFKAVYDYLDKKSEIEVYVLCRPEFHKKEEVFNDKKELNE